MAAQQHMLKQMIEQATHAHIAQEEAKVRVKGLGWAETLIARPLLHERGGLRFRMNWMRMRLQSCTVSSSCAIHKYIYI